MASEFDDDDDDFFASLGIHPVPGDRPSSAASRGADAFGSGQFSADATLYQPAPLFWHELKSGLRPAEEHEVAAIIGSDIIDRNEVRTCCCLLSQHVCTWTTWFHVSFEPSAVLLVVCLCVAQGLFAEAKAYAQILEDFHSENQRLRVRACNTPCVCLGLAPPRAILRLALFARRATLPQSSRRASRA